jgi:hypothetical protein
VTSDNEPTPEEILKDEQQLKRVNALAELLTPPLSQLDGEPFIIQMMAVGGFVMDWLHRQDDPAKALDELKTYREDNALD